MSNASLLFFGIAYAVCSSTLIVINKWALTELATPSFLFLVQTIATVLVVWVVNHFANNSIGKLQRSWWQWLAGCVVIQFLTIESNMFSLHYLGVDRVILLRIFAMFPIAIGDYLFNNRMIPSLACWICFACLGVASLFVFGNDSHGVSALGIISGICYYTFITIDQVMLKTFTREVKMSDAQRTVWMNLFSIPLSVLGAAVSMEHRLITWEKISSLRVLLPLFVSSIFGAGISYTAWGLRSRASAVTFSLIGVVCKIGSMSLNFFFFSHLSIPSLLMITLSILSTFYYEQAPERPKMDDVERKQETQSSTPLYTPSTKHIPILAIFLTILAVGIFSLPSVSSYFGNDYTSAAPIPGPDVTSPIVPIGPTKESRPIVPKTAPIRRAAPPDATRISTFKSSGSTYSWHSCVGETAKQPWRLRSCHFQRVCFTKEAKMVFYAKPNDIVSEGDLETATMVPYSTDERVVNKKIEVEIRRHPMENDSDAMYFPHGDPLDFNKLGKEDRKVARSRRNVTVIADLFLPGTWTHLVFDNFFPMYRMLKIFGMPDAAVQPLSLTGECTGISCHRESRHDDWIDIFTKRRFKPTMFDEYFNETVADSDGLLCFNDVMSGVGTLSDHGLGDSAHGREREKPDWLLFGQGATFWEFRNWSLERAGIKPEDRKHTPGRNDVVIIRKGKRADNPGLNLDGFEKNIREYADELKSPTLDIQSALPFENMTVTEQLQTFATTKVMFAQSGSTGYGAFWMPPGSTVILISNREIGYLDYFWWTNIPYVQTHFVFVEQSTNPQVGYLGFIWNKFFDFTTHAMTVRQQLIEAKAKDFLESALERFSNTETDLYSMNDI